MAGQMGNERVTVQSLDVVRADAERNLLLVKGGVPVQTGCDLIVKPAVKAQGIAMELRIERRAERADCFRNYLRS